MLGQEAMTLLHGRVLLKCEWVHLAQDRKPTFGFLQTLLLLSANVWIRLRLGLTFGDFIARGTRRGGHQLIGSVFGDKDVGFDAEVLEGLGFDLLDPHPLLGSGKLVAMNTVTQPLEFGGQCAQLLTDHNEFIGAFTCRPLQLDANALGLRNGNVNVGSNNGYGLHYCLRNYQVAGTTFASLRSSLTGTSFDLSIVFQCNGAIGHGRHAFFGCSHRQAGIHFLGACALRCLLELGAPIGSRIC